MTTPGPWQKHKPLADSPGFFYVGPADGSGQTFATVHDNEYIPVDAAMAEANADLITAAPDLLALIEAFVAIHDEITDNHEGDEEDLYMRAQAVIAKARGEAVAR